MTAEYGYPAETFAFPNGVDLSSVAYPESTYDKLPRGNIGDNTQGSAAPAYQGVYELGFREDSGTRFDTANYLLPAPGSADLVAPRQQGGIPGTNRIIASHGPVDGDTDEVWANRRDKVNRPVYGQNGPVKGGHDHSQMLAAAVYQQAQQIYSEAAATAAMVSAV